MSQEPNIWICRSCCWGAKIVIFEVPEHRKPIAELMYPDDVREYVCQTCWIRGWMSDGDAPIQVTREEADLYWRELQTENTFLPPRLSGDSNGQS